MNYTFELFYFSEHKGTKKAFILFRLYVFYNYLYNHKHYIYQKKLSNQFPSCSIFKSKYVIQQLLTVNCNSSSVCLKNYSHSAKHNFYIQPNRPCINVFQIHPHPFLKRHNITTFNLPYTGNTGFHTQASEL